MDFASRTVALALELLPSAAMLLALNLVVYRRRAALRRGGLRRLQLSSAAFICGLTVLLQLGWLGFDRLLVLIISGALIIPAGVIGLPVFYEALQGREGGSAVPGPMRKTP